MRNCCLVFCVLFMLSCSKSPNDAKDKLVDLDNSGVTDVFRYVSYIKKGNGDGMSPKNAADFLNITFWEEINSALKTKSVRVLFEEGDYSRVFTLRGLVLNNMGNPNHKLTLEGVVDKTIFSAPADAPVESRSVLFDMRNSQNIHLKNFYFTGSGKVGYGLRITSDADKITKNIVIENCSWVDMHGVIYGAAGAHQIGTSNVTYLNCTFKRVGIDSHSHHIYNAYGPSHVYIINSHFEDCTGDYVRFRDDMEYGIVKGSTFVRNQGSVGRVFISAPIFNSRPPVGDEYFGTNYSFTDNTFTNKSSVNTDHAITFYHSGFSPPDRKYLLTAVEGNTLQTGSVSDKKALLLNNFGIDTDKIRVSGNTYSSKIITKIALGTFFGYGAESKGFSGWGDITNICNDSVEPFFWEKE